ncbi:hypothetical protein IKF57_00395 [Candidatus Saccharibacteria bacterium]|nr:hypothetical protein [Candidatus Saccharibacteria bacterium]
MARRRKRSKKWISWLILLVLLIAAIVVCVFVYNSYFTEEVRPEEPTPAPIVEPIAPAGEEIEVELPSSGTEKEKIVQYDGEDPNQAGELTGVVTYAGVAGDKLMIRINIDQYLASGSCELNLMRNGAVVYSASARIIDSATTATCEGFDIPVSGLGGNYQILINVAADGKTGVIKSEVNV